MMENSVEMTRDALRELEYEPEDSGEHMAFICDQAEILCSEIDRLNKLLASEARRNDYLLPAVRGLEEKVTRGKELVMEYKEGILGPRLLDWATDD